MSFIKVEHGENECLILNPDCSNKIFMDYIRQKCKVKDGEVIDLIDENAWASELFTKKPTDNVLSLFQPRGVYILASIELYEDQSIKKITPMLQDWEKKYQFLERKLKHWDKKQAKLAEEKAAPEQAAPTNASKDSKLNRKRSERTSSATVSNRKESMSPTPDSGGKKKGKKRK